ncbi:hypothetical protein PVAR5_4070 [Paecilomyces variotii No. 5]|uniref:Uncharacterized protein n=1 Tax=Byssochlamys spectabilis (strain No. 5 / NBRC 109023) TaxID=1356009 RepID=V5G3K1_BYSSN|nr:hypothetical protein PVAR5_4070 [Paecilomyces variotii No. 5]
MRMRGMASPAAMAPPSNRLLDDDLFTVVAVEKQRNQSGPEEEQDLHDPKCKARLEHGAGLVQIDCRPVPLYACPEWAERDGDGTTIPVRAVLVGDEAKLVHAGDKGAEKAKVQKSHEDRGAPGGAEPDGGVDGPEHGDDGDDEEDEDVGWC